VADGELFDPKAVESRRKSAFKFVLRKNYFVVALDDPLLLAKTKAEKSSTKGALSILRAVSCCADLEQLASCKFTWWQAYEEGHQTQIFSGMKIL
jgi:hypothetical protein